MEIFQQRFLVTFYMNKNVCVLVGVLFFSMMGGAHSEENSEHLGPIRQEGDQENTKGGSNGTNEEQPPKNKQETIKELAIQVQNPVSDLVRFGFTNTIAFGSGPTNSNINVLNLNANTTRQFGQWSLLNRLNVPLLYLPESVPDAPSGDSGRSFGLGDIEYTAFLARDESKRVLKSIGGIGPTIIFKSATDDRMGLGKWSIGPTMAIARMQYPWVHGVLLRNIWSFAGDSDRPKVNFFLIQPFVNYNFTSGWYLTSTPGIIANWEADSRNRWTVPIGGGIGKLLFRGDKHPVNLRLQSFYFLEKPDIGPDWSLNFEFRILFPQ